MSTKKVRLQDICISISDGDHQAPPKSNSGVPFVTISNITNLNQIDFCDTMFVPRWYYEKIDSKRKAKANDILYSVVGSFGIPVFIKNNKEFIFQRHIAILRPNIKEIVPEYLYYVMLGREFYMIADSVAVGAAQRTITLSSLRNIEIVIPEIVKQQRIVNILSAYDDLIENNQKQIKLLEEAAQRLYKEWFVDLRFPGYEKVEVVDGVPEGWNIRKLADLNHRLESGSRPKGGIDSNLKDGIPSIGAENVIGLGKYNFSTEKLISKEFYENMNKGKLKDRDILIYKDGAYIGRTSLFQDDFPHREASVNEHVFLLHMDDEALQYYIFLTLYSPEYYLKMQNLNKNAAQPGINMKIFKTLDVLVPDEAIVVEFNDLVSPMIKSIFSKSKQIKILTEARDRLLPKLMSGEIEV